MSTNAIFDAALALVSGVTWSGGGFVESGRRLKQFDQAQQPSIFQVEPDEDFNAKSDGLLTKRTLSVMWVIYHAAGNDQSIEPARYTSDLIDALTAAIPNRLPGTRQTLGGLVHAIFIDGKIRKFEGDLDGQTIITVPVTIILP